MPATLECSALKCSEGGELLTVMVAPSGEAASKDAFGSCDSDRSSRDFHKSELDPT